MSQDDDAGGTLTEVVGPLFQEMVELAPEGWSDLLVVVWADPAGGWGARMWVEGPDVERHRVRTPDLVFDLVDLHDLHDRQVAAGGPAWDRCDLHVTRVPGADGAPDPDRPETTAEFSVGIGEIPDGTDVPQPDPVEAARVHREAVDALLARPATERGPAPVVGVSGDQVLDAMRDWDPAVREEFLAGSRPALEFARRSPGPAGPALGASRIGGLPDLPRGMAWPTWEDPVAGRRPLAFFAQIALEGVADLLDLPLPSVGMLLFFCDFDFSGGGPGVTGEYDEDAAAVLVRYVPAGATLVRTAPPGEVQLVPEALLAPIVVPTFPDVALAEVLVRGSSEAVETLDGVLHGHLADVVPPGYDLDGRHRFGGWARSVQRYVGRDVADAASGASRRSGPGGVRTPSGPIDWLMLLQIDDDEMFDEDYLLGDGGTVYWFVPWDESSTRLDLEHVRFAYQCS